MIGAEDTYMINRTILISNATYRQSISLAHNIKKYNPSVTIIGCSEYNPIGVGAYYQFYDGWEVGEFLNLVESIPHWFAIPIGVKELQLFLEKSISPLLIPSKEAYNIASNKELLYDLTENLHIKTSKVYTPISLDRLLDIRAPFPWLIKGVLDSDENINRIAYNLTEARKAFYEEQNDPTQKDNPPIVKEYIRGDKISFQAFYQHGVLKRYTIQRSIRELPKTGGYCTASETIDHPKAKEIGMKILDFLSWNGPAAVEFKRRS